MDNATPIPTEPTVEQLQAAATEARKQFITQNYGTVVACGHKFHPNNEPRTNCQDCWEAFFRVHEALIKGIQATIAAFGMAALSSARGEHFVKQYKKFAAKIEEEQRNVTVSL